MKADYAWTMRCAVTVTGTASKRTQMVGTYRSGFPAESAGVTAFMSKRDLSHIRLHWKAGLSNSARWVERAQQRVVYCHGWTEQLQHRIIQGHWRVYHVTSNTLPLPDQG